ncbi:hypothetical protein HFK18_13145|uniref:hypothetical protein n=1 Tax=Stenotrophomonas sp. SbOxS2 TaxID=2723885 RepID=UPI0015D41109|nr:hypothetical protein [Stenotrophomonas sp. SbOxS2]NYT99423.1 hypothetical protein [Stenotrophomonas sp. SbOxS2]
MKTVREQGTSHDIYGSLFARDSGSDLSMEDAHACLVRDHANRVHQDWLAGAQRIAKLLSIRIAMRPTPHPQVTDLTLRAPWTRRRECLESSSTRFRQ